MLLKTFRNASHSIVIKILFGAIIFSFCLWGVGDIIKNYAASKSVFSVEKMKVTSEQFLREYSSEKQRIRNIGSKPLSDDEMKKLNIKGMVLDNLIQKSVVEATFNKLNIIVPKKSLLNIVQSLPEFQNNGSFDPKVYEMALRRSGINESGFLMQIRDNVGKTQLFHPIISGYKIPSFIKDVMTKEFESKKTVLVSKIKVDDIKIDEKIADDELRQYYDNNSEKYKKPETRNVALLVVDYQGLAKDFAITDEEVNEYYNSNKEAYASKEKRDFERFVFDAKEDADKAWNMMNRGTPSKEIVQKFTPNMETIKDREISDFPINIGKEVFDLKLKKTSEVYAIGGKFYVYRVINIKTPKHKNEAEVKAEIRKSLQNEKMNSPEFYAKIKDVKNKIDDGFGSGKSIEEVSKETGMRCVELKDFKKTNDDANLKAIVSDEDTRTDIVETIFSTDEKQASQTIDSKETDTVSYVVFVRSIEKSSVPEFEKIKEQVKKDFIFEKKDKAANEKINEITNKKLEASKSVSKMHDVKKFRFSKKELLTNKDHSSKEIDAILKELPNVNVVLNVISTLRKGEANHYKISENEYIVVAIDDVEKIENTTPEFKNVMSQYIDSGSANDIVPVAMDAFKKNLKINIDHKFLDEITKTTDEQDEEKN